MNTGLKNAIRAEMECRAKRYQTIPADLLGEPAWDILLDLAISLLEQTRIQITSVGLTAGLPQTTALRWICRLEDLGLIRRVRDQDDGRRTWLEILPQAMMRLAACFGYDWQREGVAVPSGRGSNQDAASRGIFFAGQNEGQPGSPDQSLVGGNKSNARSASKALLLKRATDWVNQDYDQRLSFSAQALYVHSYISPHEYRRIELQVREDAEKARDDKVRARREKLW